MKENFAIGFDLVMRWEGGYVDDPDDPGGVTKWGIALNRIGRTLGLRRKDIVGMTREGAKKIYITHYWDKCNCGSLPNGIDVAVFDTSVNQGTARAARFLQRAVGVTTDGVIGSMTLRVAHQNPNALRDFMVYRALHYSSLSKITKYGRGWFRRLFDCHATAVWLQIGD